MLPVIVVAGGLATRMRPLTEKIPKAMIDVNGKPFIYHQLCLLKRKGVDKVILCLGYFGKQIEEYVKDGAGFGLSVEYSYDGDKLLGTGGAISRLGARLPQDSFVLYGDSYLDIDYQAVEDAYHRSGRKGLMTVFRNEGRWDESNVVFKDERVAAYSKRHKTVDMHYIDYGLGILESGVFAAYPEGMSFDLADVYEDLSASGELAGYEVFERFYEIGSPQGLEDLLGKLKLQRFE